VSATDVAASVTTGESSAAILVVDDNAAKRLALVSVLAPLGHVLVEAASGEAALRVLMRRAFAVILMDVKMPGMDGYETARLLRLREECEDTPVIFVTSYERDEVEIPHAYAIGAVDFIFSPIVPEVIRAKVSVFVTLFLNSLALERSLNAVTILSDQFRDSEARISSVLANVGDGIITIGEGGEIESFNRAATRLFGYSDAEAIGQPFANMVAAAQSDDQAGQDRGQTPKSQNGRNERAVASLGRRNDGSTFPMELNLNDVQLGSRKIRVGCVRDISEQQSYTAALQHQAMHDALTELPNRTLFGDRVEHAIRAASRDGKTLAVLVLDLDEFKQVNDTFSHQHGDALLKLVAERLVGCLRDGDTVARLGGDEFGVLPFTSTNSAAAASVARTIQAALEPAFLVDGHTIDVRTSIGVALYPKDGADIDDLLRRADLAMYEAKRSGGGYALFTAEQEQRAARRLELLGDLRHCITRDELVLHYQPKVDLATRRAIGVEALIRWNHPSGRLLPPGAFIPEVENNELIIPITEWVIRESLRSLAHLREQGYDLTIAVNLGRRCLSDATRILTTADDWLEAFRIPADKLTFEITERELVDTAMPGLMEQLQHMDEHLSIDDFGTGYSSLAYLQRLPITEIKIDQSFVTSLASVQEDAVIVRSTIDLAHNLSLAVVAEGVEDQTTMELLIDYGCDTAQGYYFAQPMTCEDLRQWLETSPHGQVRQIIANTPPAPSSTHKTE
jgi:diguanylate cyclase (GGDEF)-like protein/PAS domain S-box-containing protein